GLIISIADTKGTWNMDFIGINDNYHKNIAMDKYIPEPRQKVSKQKFFEIKNYVKENAFMLYAAKENSGYASLTEKYKKRLKDFLEQAKKTDNNWIELHP